MITLIHAPERSSVMRELEHYWIPPLTWDDWLWGAGPFTKTALVCCANGHTATVNPQIHTIADDGTLSPSWVCPFEDCGWHEFARLEGWRP